MISELLPEEKRKLHEIEHQIADLEHGSTTIHVLDVQMGIKEMAFRLDELDKLVQNEPKTRRDDFRRRVQHLRNSHSHISSSLEALIRRRERSDYDYQRRELFSGAGGRSELEDIEMQVEEGSSLNRSSRMLDEYINVGRDTLSNLMSQKERLKGIQRKAFDILNYLGIANNIMKYIERRDFTDRWIVYGGMIVILLLIVFVWFYLVK